VVVVMMVVVVVTMSRRFVEVARAARGRSAGRQTRRGCRRRAAW
jgi:hypothetical protein